MASTTSRALRVVEAGEQVGERDAGVDAAQLGRQAQDAGLARRQAAPSTNAGTASHSTQAIGVVPSWS